MFVHLHIYEFILLLYIIYFLSQVSEVSFVCKREWHLKLNVFVGNLVQYDTDFILMLINLCL